MNDLLIQAEQEMNWMIASTETEEALTLLINKEKDIDWFMKTVLPTGDSITSVMSALRERNLINVVVKSIELDVFSWICQFGEKRELHHITRRVHSLANTLMTGTGYLSIKHLAQNPHIDDMVFENVFYSLWNIPGSFLDFFNAIPEQMLFSHLYLFKGFIQTDKSIAFRKEMMLRVRSLLESEGVVEGLPDEWLLHLITTKDTPQ